LNNNVISGQQWLLSTNPNGKLNVFAELELIKSLSAVRDSPLYEHNTFVKSGPYYHFIETGQFSTGRALIGPMLFGLASLLSSSTALTEWRCELNYEYVLAEYE
jgi:hypothetical protein